VSSVRVVPGETYPHTDFRSSCLVNTRRVGGYLGTTAAHTPGGAAEGDCRGGLPRGRLCRLRAGRSGGTFRAWEPSSSPPRMFSSRSRAPRCESSAPNTTSSGGDGHGARPWKLEPRRWLTNTAGNGSSANAAHTTLTVPTGNSVVVMARPQGDDPCQRGATRNASWWCM
jgi:hypothetical protein